MPVHALTTRRSICGFKIGKSTILTMLRRHCQKRWNSHENTSIFIYFTKTNQWCSKNSAFLGSYEEGTTEVESSMFSPLFLGIKMIIIPTLVSLTGMLTTVWSLNMLTTVVCQWTSGLMVAKDDPAYPMVIGLLGTISSVIHLTNHKVGIQFTTPIAVPSIWSNNTLTWLRLSANYAYHSFCFHLASSVLFFIELRLVCHLHYHFEIQAARTANLRWTRHYSSHSNLDTLLVHCLFNECIEFVHISNGDYATLVSLGQEVDFFASNELLSKHLGLLKQLHWRAFYEEENRNDACGNWMSWSK